MPEPEKRKLKIAISIFMFWPNTGGLQAHAELLCKYLQERGHDVFVVTRAASQPLRGTDFLFFSEPASSLTVKGIKVKPLKFARSWAPLLWIINKFVARDRFKSWGARLYQIVARKPAREVFAGVDIVHQVSEAAPLIGFAAADAARYWQVPFIVQPTCHPNHNGDSPFDFMMYSNANRLLVHTQSEADFFKRKQMRCPVDVVGNGIEDRADGNAERFREKFGITGPFILFIGRKDSQKGCLLLIEAYKLIRQQRPDIRLVCMGPTIQGVEIEKMDGLLDLEFASEELKHDALAACTCLCVPSVAESFGLVFMEAGRYGKPVVARNVAVLRELLGKDEAGLLLGTPDENTNSAALSPDELATALLKLIADPDTCRRLGENCRRVSAKFIWPLIVERFEASYYQALNHSPKMPASKI
jgi:glycosyltransferase involved in cell wall biosynthesis